MRHGCAPSLVDNEDAKRGSAQTFHCVVSVSDNISLSQTSKSHWDASFVLQDQISSHLKHFHVVLTRQTKNGVLHTTLEALKSKIGICEKYFLNKSGGGLENIPKIYQLRYESSTLIIYKELSK